MNFLLLYHMKMHFILYSVRHSRFVRYLAEVSEGEVQDFLVIFLW